MTGGTDAGLEYRRTRASRAWRASRTGSRAGAKTNPSAAADIVKQLREEADQLEKGQASHFFDALIGAIESGDRRAVSAQLPPILKNDGEAIGNALRAPELEQTCITTQSVTHAHSPAMRVFPPSPFLPNRQ
jgi:hypothetical protein